jgi:16S rRNA (adenine1518-N6/adenine1519-N6)-dimethyltransferase
MPLYSPRDLKAALSHLGTDAKKALSQNFLIDGNIVRKIADAIPCTAQDSILEIGPGPGALTECILERKAPHSYIGIEKDRLFIKHLQHYFAHCQIATFYEADILQFPIEKHVQQGKYHIVGNLPYSLTSPIFDRISSVHSDIQSATVMIQEEVARRVVAQPKTSDYSLLSIGLQLFFDVTYLFTVSNRCFYPPPKVQSAVIQLIPKQVPAGLQVEEFLQFIRIGFQQKRKTLRASYRGAYSSEEVTGALAQIGLTSLSRPAELSITEWITFFQLLKGY